VRDNGEVAEITAGVDLSSLAHDVIVLTQALLLSGELAKAEPKRLRYWLLHVRRLARVLRPPRRPQAAGQLAVGRRTRRRVRTPQSAPAPA
jgi:hypothetical protein